MTSRPSSGSLRDRLVRLIEEIDPGMATPLGDDTSLIRSGMLDSTAIFHVALWIERETGSLLDPDGFDPSRDWDTIADILGFVERHRRRGVPEEGGDG